MSRKPRNHKRSRRYTKRVQRDYQYNPNIDIDVLHPITKELFHVEDRRRFHPDKLGQRNLTYSGKIARTDYNDFYGKQTTQNRVHDSPRFVDNRRAIVCRRRSIRRRSLFATLRIGKGKGSHRKRILTEDSKVRCR